MNWRVSRGVAFDQPSQEGPELVGNAMDTRGFGIEDINDHLITGRDIKESDRGPLAGFQTVTNLLSKVP